MIGAVINAVIASNTAIPMGTKDKGSERVKISQHSGLGVARPVLLHQSSAQLSERLASVGLTGPSESIRTLHQNVFEEVKGDHRDGIEEFKGCPQNGRDECAFRTVNLNFASPAAGTTNWYKIGPKW